MEKVYREAKSVVKYDDYTNVLKHLKKALKILYEASKKSDSKK
ncbi:hypothetical protein [Clostridium sp.]|nr:hypothetical protein [Clostridium sp.]MDU4848499.1 hypothetical protein [Clostridium sp.]